VRSYAGPIAAPATSAGIALRGYGTPATVGQTIPYGYAASGNYVADSVGAVHVAKREAEAEPEADAWYANYGNTLGYGNIGYGSIGYGNVGYAAPAVAAVAPVAAVRSYAAPAVVAPVRAYATHTVAPIAAVRSYAGPIAASAGYSTLGYGARLGYSNLW